MATFEVGDRVVVLDKEGSNLCTGAKGTVIREPNEYYIYVLWDAPWCQKYSEGGWSVHRFDKAIENIDDELDAIPITVAR